jgi:hypothetical protein
MKYHTSKVLIASENYIPQYWQTLKLSQRKLRDYYYVPQLHISTICYTHLAKELCRRSDCKIYDAKKRSKWGGSCRMVRTYPNLKQPLTGVGNARELWLLV